MKEGILEERVHHTRERTRIEHTITKKGKEEFSSRMGLEWDELD